MTTLGNSTMMTSNKMSYFKYLFYDQKSFPKIWDHRSSFIFTFKNDI